MRCEWTGQAQKRSYRTGSSLVTVIGGVLIAAGLLLLFLCIPGWFWAAMAGVVLIVLGYLLIVSGSNRR